MASHLSFPPAYGMPFAWSHLPEPLRAHILLRAADTVQRLCSLSMWYVMRAFDVDRSLLEAHPIQGFASPHAVDRARRLGGRYKDLYLRRACPDSVWARMPDGTVRQLSRGRDSFSTIASVLWNADSVLSGDVMTFRQWLETDEAMEQYEWLVIGRRYRLHRERKRRRQRAQTLLYDSSTDSGSDWYESDAERCIVLRRASGERTSDVELHTRALRTGDPLLLHGTDLERRRYARRLRDLAQNSFQRERKEVMVLPPPRRHRLR